LKFSACQEQTGPRASEGEDGPRQRVRGEIGWKIKAEGSASGGGGQSAIR
jgi:hypothetical protein